MPPAHTPPRTTCPIHRRCSGPGTPPRRRRRRSRAASPRGRCRRGRRRFRINGISKFASWSTGSAGSGLTGSLEQDCEGSGCGESAIGDPLAATAVPEPLNEQDCVDVGNRAARGQSSMSVHPAGASTGTPPMMVERSGSDEGGVLAGVERSGSRRFPTATNATASTATPAMTPTAAVRAWRRRPRRSTGSGASTSGSTSRAR